MAGETDNSKPSNADVIFYCEQCGQRIPPADFRNKTAHLSSDNLACCARCASARLAASPSATPAEMVARAESHSTHSPRQTANRRNAPYKATSPSNMWITFGGGAVLVVALIISFVIVSGGTAQKNKSGSARAPESSGSKAIASLSAAASKPPATTQSSPVSQPVPQNLPTAHVTIAPGSTEKAPTRSITPPVEEYDPRKAVSESLLTQAKDYHQKNPDDLYTYSEKLEWLRDRYRGTAAAEEAHKLLTKIKLPEPDPNTNPAPPTDDDFKQAVSVLASIRPKEDSRKGRWSSGNSTIRSDLSKWSKLESPCILPEEYDLRATFSRVDRDDCLLIVLARRGNPFVFSIGGNGNKGCSFETIAEKRKDRVPTKISRPGVLSNGVKNQVVVQVRRDCLRAYLNGKLIVGCQVEDAGLSLPKEFQMSQPGQLGLMTWSSIYEFHAIEIRPIAGEVRMLR